jgi:hypothetical protein
VREADDIRMPNESLRIREVVSAENRPRDGYFLSCLSVLTTAFLVDQIQDEAHIHLAFRAAQGHLDDWRYA